MWDKALDTSLSTIKFVRECFMTQEVLDKAVHIFFSYLILFLISIKLKKCVT